MATLIVTPAGVVPESIGFVQACVMLDAEPTQSIMITLQTTDVGSAQGKLSICKHLLLINNYIAKNELLFQIHSRK